jgi:hypothetical protein
LRAARHWQLSVFLRLHLISAFKSECFRRIFVFADFSTSDSGSEGGAGAMLAVLLALIGVVCAVLYYLNAGKASGKHDEL